MKKIFTFLVAVLFAGLFSAQAEPQTVTFYPTTYDSASDEYESMWESFTSEIVRNADGSYTILNFFTEGQPVTFSFTPKEDAYANMTFSGNILKYDDPDYPYPYLRTADGKKFATLTAIDKETGNDVIMTYPYFFTDGYSKVYSYNSEDAVEYGDYYGVISLYADGEEDEELYVDVEFSFDEMPVPEAPSYFVVGAFNGWNEKDEATKMTLASDGTYTFDYEGIFSGEFVITNGTWDVKYTSNGSPLEIGKAYELTKGGANIKLTDPAIKDAHFVFNPDETAPILTVTGEATELPSYYSLKGAFTDWKAVKMEDVSGVWTLVGVEVAAPGEFLIVKFLEGLDAEQGWIKSPTSADVTLSVAMEAGENGGNWKIAEPGTYTFQYDPKAGTLTVSDTSGVEGIAADNDAVVEYFNLQGIKVANPENGVFIRRQGSKVSKVAL